MMAVNPWDYLPSGDARAARVRELLAEAGAVPPKPAHRATRDEVLAVIAEVARFTDGDDAMAKAGHEALETASVVDLLKIMGRFLEPAVQGERMAALAGRPGFHLEEPDISKRVGWCFGQVAAICIHAAQRFGVPKPEEIRG